MNMFVRYGFRLLFLLAAWLMPCAGAAAPFVSLSPSLTELVCHLGGEKQLIGRSSACDYPASVARLPVAGRFADPNLETVLRLKPRYLLTNDLINPGIIKPLQQAGIEVKMLPCRTLAEYRRSVAELGELLPARDAAKKELERVDAFAAKPPPALDMKTLWVIWDYPLMVAGQGSFPDEVLRLAGVRNLAGNVPQQYFKCSFDWLLSNPPDVIIWSAAPRKLTDHRVWKKLRAVRDGKVIQDLNADILLRPGPRLFDGVTQLRQKLEQLQR